ncbi:MAG: hypothetical protein GY715_10815 [Planctomycetes bacterium]|nr:hypothetical protein [Planctomycetota bacterium]
MARGRGAVTLWDGRLTSGAGLTNNGRIEGYGDVYANIDNDGLLTILADTQVVGDCDNAATITIQNGALSVFGDMTGSGQVIGDFFAGAAPRGGSDGAASIDGFFVQGDLSLGPRAALLMASETAVARLGGDFDVAIDDQGRFHLALAELRMVGLSGQSLETMSTDIGPDPAGLDRTRPGHFPVGTLRIGPTHTTVSLADTHDNDGVGQVPCEAIYVQSLIIDEGAMLSTNGCHVYYGDAQVDGSIDDPANVIPIEFTPPCPWDLNGNGQVDFADILAVIGAWGPCPPDCPHDLNGNGNVDFADILAVIGSWGPCP